jgi:Ser/Thr protein kinase RdoA (MazF antagonist)
MSVPSDRILQIASARFGIDAQSVSLLRDAANTVYACHRHGKPCILRLSRTGARTRHLILGEMEWLGFASDRCGCVAAPLRSLRGEWVETIADGPASYSVVLFERAPGVHPEGGLLTDDVLKAIGATLGKLHGLGAEYEPSHPTLRRPHWHELEAFQLETDLPQAQPEVLSQFRATWELVQQLPTDPVSYGFIHGDPEPWNMMLHNGVIRFIDFEECCYCWRAFDLAVALVFAVYAANAADQDKFAQKAWQAIYRGYTKEVPLSSFWIDQIPTLMRLRLFEDYAFHLRLRNRGHREDWLQPLIRQQRELIESGAPVLSVDLRAVIGE